MRPKPNRLFSRAAAMLLMMMLTTATAWAWSGSGTTADPYIISSSADWTTFCDLLDNSDKGYFTGKTVKLANSITVTRMAGSSQHDFTGTFDGQGKTITLAIGSAESPFGEDYAALFRNVTTTKANPSDAEDSPANIHSLVVDGHIYTSQKYAAGIVGNQYGTVSISNCHVSTIIHSSKNGDGTHGGIVANQHGGALTLSGCIYDGRMLTTNGTTDCGGLVGYHSGGSCTISNCLYAPTNYTPAEGESFINSGATICRNYDGTPANCYYTQTLGTEQGTDASGMSSTELAEALGYAWHVSDDKVLPYMGQNYYVYYDTSDRKYRSALVPDGATVVTATDNYQVNTWGTDGETTWYVVQGAVTSNNYIYLYGTVNIVICDGATLTVKTGLRLRSSNSTLNIYAQSDGTGMGAIVATGTDTYSPGIGVYYNDQINGSTCAVNIHGGKITATGGSFTAGIGGGNRINAGTINIYGGAITAQGGNKAAGIGSGYPSSSVTSLVAINIYGGKINATGGDNGAGIGGGGGISTTDITGGPINIYGGQITATAGASTADQLPAGIGKGAGWRHSGYNVFLSWTDADNDFIQASSYGGGTVTIDPDHPFKRSSDGAEATTSNIGGQKIVPAQATVYTVTFDTGGGTAVASQGVIQGQTATQPGNPVKQGYRFVKWQLSGADYDFSTAVTADITLTAVWTALPDITYQNASDVTTALAGADYSPLEPSVTTLNGGTWVVVDDATTFADRITVKGSVTIILTDGKTLTAQRGIGVTAHDNAVLTVLAQSGGSGALSVTGVGNNGDACIGGDFADNRYGCGTVKIYGGHISTSGNYLGAGIGGANGSAGGTISILGGQVDIYGSSLGQAIGYGYGATDNNATATITLGWTRETDYICLHNYQHNNSTITARYRGTVTLASNFLIDGMTPVTKACWTSTGNNIDGQKLVPTQLVLMDWTDVQEALTAGRNITLTNDVTSESTDKSLTVPENVTAAINLNGHTLTHEYASDTYLEEAVIIVDGGSLTVSDGSSKTGKIVGNKMGIYNLYGTLTMTGGTINTTETGICNYGTATVSGITISGCSDEYAIYNDHGALSMTDCSVTDNTDGGVYNNGTLTLSGKVNITGNTQLSSPENVYLDGSSVITLGGALDSYSRIGVNCDDYATITTGAKGNAVLANFTCDETDKYVCWTTDGTEIQLSETYAMSENDGLADIVSRYAEQNVPVTFTRTFTEGVASTICLPFPMMVYSDYADYGTFYSFVGVEKGTDKWTVTMAEEASHTPYYDFDLTTGTPYLFLPKKTGTVTFKPSDGGNTNFIVPQGGFTPGVVTPNTTLYPNAAGWTFKGTFTGEQWAEAPQTPTYGFSAQAVAADGISRGEFVRVGAKVRIRPFRAYMQYVAPSDARGMNRAAADAADLPDVLTVRLIGADGELTGIGQMDTRTGQVTFDAEAWYSMDGVRLPSKPTTKGVYINNGKQVVIK